MSAYGWLVILGLFLWLVVEIWHGLAINRIWRDFEKAIRSRGEP